MVFISRKEKIKFIAHYSHVQRHVYDDDVISSFNLLLLLKTSRFGCTFKEALELLYEYN